jgi:cytochrome c biogenesis protein CcdA
VGQLLLSTTILASFLGGVVALLAPCCVSVMLPAYFASTFQRRSRIVGMTLVFAAGVGTVILPVALGASALVFSIGGAAMIIGGFAMLAGWKFSLPMLSLPARTGGGVGSVYSLGVFSGAASACCAPVLAGVAAVSGAASSFPTALAVGVAYVFGMVAPLSAPRLGLGPPRLGRRAAHRPHGADPGRSATAQRAARLGAVRWPADRNGCPHHHDRRWGPVDGLGLATAAHRMARPPQPHRPGRPGMDARRGQHRAGLRRTGGPCRAGGPAAANSSTTRRHPAASVSPADADCCQPPTAQTTEATNRERV